MRDAKIQQMGTQSAALYFSVSGEQERGWGLELRELPGGDEMAEKGKSLGPQAKAGSCAGKTGEGRGVAHACSASTQEADAGLL